MQLQMLQMVEKADVHASPLGVCCVILSCTFAVADMKNTIMTTDDRSLK